jgi:catechol 2,3-dioxygenase-like lactoylglutathione lyase family enzyme
MIPQAIIETAIYVDDLEAAENFYHDTLGLTVIGKEQGHHVFFQVGDKDVLLAFRADSTLRGDSLPSHGAKGAGHFALGIQKGFFEAWRKQLTAGGVAIKKETDWPLGGKSLYFRDPAGNLVELITPGILGLPSGW